MSRSAKVSSGKRMKQWARPRKRPNANWARPDGCCCGLRAPSQCCASWSRARTAQRSRRWRRCWRRACAQPPGSRSANLILVAVVSRHASAETPRNVILGLFLAGIDENFVGDIEFDQFAQVHVGSVVGYARCLLHVMGDNGDGVVGLEFVQQFLDL